MFHQIRELLQKKSDFFALIEDCSDYMASGKYHVENVFGKLALRKGSFPKGKLKNWYYQIVCGTYRIENHSNRANCNIALLSPFCNYKMFDEAARCTYTKFSDSYWNNICLYYEKMAPYFHTLILSLDREHHILVEKYIKSDVIRDEKAFFLDFCDSFLRYCDGITWTRTLSVKQVKEELDRYELQPEVRTYVDYLESKIINDTEEYPVIVCHNDVHTRNVLTEDNRTYNLIDFELCGENVFFFDVFGFIFNSAVFKEDHHLFDKYINDEFNEVLSRVFKAFGLEYKKEEKLHYLYLFLYFKIYLVFRSSPGFLKSYTNKIVKFIDYLSVGKADC